MGGLESNVRGKMTELVDGLDAVVWEREVSRETHGCRAGRAVTRSPT